MVSPPVRRRKDWLKEFIMVSFGLPYQVVSPRIAMSVEAYPNRWTHHVIVENADAIDETLLAWIDKAYSFFGKQVMILLSKKILSKIRFMTVR